MIAEKENSPGRSVMGRGNRICSVKVVEVVQVIAQVGAGTEGDPVRDVITFWTTDGRFIGEWDMHAITDSL